MTASRPSACTQAPRRALIAVVPIVLGCGLLTLTVEETTVTTVPGSGLLGELLGALDFSGLDDFDVTIEQQLEDEGVEPGDLRSVVVTTLRLSAEPDLAFLEQLDVYVSAEGVPEVLVATGATFPAGTSAVDLDLTGADLTDAVIAGSMAFRVTASGSPPVDDTDITVLVAVEIDATAQGTCRAAADG